MRQPLETREVIIMTTYEKIALALAFLQVLLMIFQLIR